LLIVSAVCALPATSALADDPGTNLIEAGVFGGVFMPEYDHDLFDAGTVPHQPLKRAGLDMGLRLGYFPVPFVGVEGEGSAVYTKTRTPTEDTVFIYNLRASLVLQVPLRVTPFVFGGVGDAWLRSDDKVLGNDRDMVLHAGAGIKAFLNNDVFLRLDGRYYNSRSCKGCDSDGSERASHWGATLGLGIRFGGVPPIKTSIIVRVGPADDDKDGFAGSEDACPSDPGVAPDGCPAKDTDGDGFVGVDDKCPDQPETVNQHEDEDGCPDEMPDADGDGVVGAADKCPDQPEDKDAFEDDDGCPEEDNDKDGVVDATDACPLETGVVENRGCPDTDKDGDSVVDRLDNCPDEAGTAANQGCKKKQLVVITQTQLKILDVVHFATGKAKILPRSKKLLDNVAQVILSHPELQKVRIEGHTDDRGDDEKNKTLSQERADSVLAYLTDKGVEAGRLEAIGYGEEKPVSSNATKKGQAANRRVEFNLGEATPPAETPPAPAPEPAPATP
jgi:outer membrane protein OmpA-like peptidoglycan-associated protein/opacity protein-like surface antigen